MKETLKAKYDLLVDSASSSDNQNLAEDVKNMSFLVEPIIKHVTTLSSERECFDYNNSCGTPKLWWNREINFLKKEKN